MKNNNTKGHILALLTIVIWGTTFISTKVLLKDFQPIEILFFRFVIGFLILLIINPHLLKKINKKQELTFVVAGFCGVFLYYLLENIALTYTMASNVGIIISVAPFFTAVLSSLIIKNDKKLDINFFIGFILAIMGISILSLDGKSLEINLKGDLLALLAAFVWACYSVLTKKISEFGHPTVLTTRRIFFYGILFMLPVMYFSDFKLDIYRFYDSINIFNMIYLGIGASAICFVTWNFAVKLIGAVKTSIYIYIVPVITVFTSAIVLKEEITLQIIIGTVLTLVGLFISDKRVFGKEKITYYFNKN